MQLRKYRLRLNRLSHILISHLHADHTLGIFGLLSTLNLLGRTAELHIFAHQELEALLHTNLNFFAHDIGYPIRFHAIPPKKHVTLFESKRISVEAFPLKHRIPASGFTVREKEAVPNIRKEMIERYSIPIAQVQGIKFGADFTTPDGQVIPNAHLTFKAHRSRSYAFCSDTSYHEPIASWVSGVDVLYHEATFGSNLADLAERTGHSTARQAAQIAQRAGVGKLIIGHFSARYKNPNVLLSEAREVFPNTYLANDGDRHSIDHTP